MPCRSDYEYSVTDEEYDRVFEECNKLTRMLCEVMKLYDIYENDVPFTISKELEEWWTKHKEIDAKREAAEKAKQKAERERDIAEYQRLKTKLGM